MTPNLPELLTGNLIAISTPPPPESAGEFAGGRIGVIGMISFMAAQEAETGVAVRVAENRAIRALFTNAAREGWASNTAELEQLSNTTDDDLTLSGVDAANAALRRALIPLHEAVEAMAGPVGRTREARILKLLREGAESRALTLPGM